MYKKNEVQDENVIYEFEFELEDGNLNFSIKKNSFF